MSLNNPLICAIDTPDVDQARKLCRSLDGQVGAIKLGLEFFSAHGPQGVRQVMAENPLPLFLDLKFHDIPHTVARAVRAACALNPFLMTVHTSGGKESLCAAVDAAMESITAPRPRLLGVTVLTSLDQADLARIGVESDVSDQARRLAVLAQEAGLDGVICSPHEIAMLRRECGKEFLLVVPGIRPEGSELGDQKRVLTPREALMQGADYLVIGRPITGQENPAAAAADILSTLSLQRRHG